MNRGYIFKMSRRAMLASLCVMLTLLAPTVSSSAVPLLPSDGTDSQDVITLPPEAFDLPPGFGDDYAVVRHPKMDSALAEVALAAEESMTAALSLA